MLLLAGCATPDAPSAMPPVAIVGQVWGPGSWWSYHVELDGSSFDVTLVVDEATPEGYRLGTNLSVGFFGLPWGGNLTPDRNPVLGGEEWPLYRHPLSDGATWRYRVMGHDAITRAVATPDGHALEASSWGRVFARYDHDANVGWFTRFELIEPSNGRTLLRATLLDHGHAFDGDYFVERDLTERHVRNPLLPGALVVPVPAGAVQVRAHLTVAADAGALRAELRDEQGRVLARAFTATPGADTASAILDVPAGALWTLHHAGAAVGDVRLKVSGVYTAT